MWLQLGMGQTTRFSVDCWNNRFRAILYRTSSRCYQSDLSAGTHAKNIYIRSNKTQIYGRSPMSQSYVGIWSIWSLRNSTINYRSRYSPRSSKSPILYARTALDRMVCQLHRHWIKRSRRKFETGQSARGKRIRENDQRYRSNVYVETLYAWSRSRTPLSKRRRQSYDVVESGRFDYRSHDKRRRILPAKRLHVNMVSFESKEQRSNFPNTQFPRRRLRKLFPRTCITRRLCIAKRNSID